MRAGLCESCRLQPAELVVSRVSKAGRHDERSLCRTCARDAERLLFGDSGLLVTDLLEVVSTERPVADGDQNRTKVCPNCGNTVNVVEESGVVGCAVCYMVFQTEVDRLIAEMHGH